MGRKVRETRAPVRRLKKEAKEENDEITLNIEY
jgi:hypothetical protein